MTTASKIESPVTGGATSFVEHYDTDVIVSRYRATNMDVSRYFKDMAKVELRRCESTGYRFFSPASLAGEAAFYDERFASQQGDAPLDYRISGEEHQYVLNLLKPGEKILDIGCGHGYFVEQAGKIADAYGIEGSLSAATACQKRGLNVRHGLSSDYVDELAGEFDIVTAFQVLEHVYEVSDFIRTAARLLRPGGRLIIAVPNNEPYFNRYNKYDTWNLPPHHIGMWDRDSLESAGRYCGLRVVSHTYNDKHGRPVVDAYHMARYFSGVKSDLHRHSLIDKARIGMLMPFTLPVSLWLRFKGKGIIARTNILVVFQRP